MISKRKRNQNKAPWIYFLFLLLDSFLFFLSLSSQLEFLQITFQNFLPPFLSLVLNQKRVLAARV